MELQFASPYDHEYNRVIERENRTIEKKIRALSVRFSIDLAATYIYNRSPHAALDYHTPHELDYSKKPYLQYLKVFGSRTYVYNETFAQCSKTAAYSNIQYLVGYPATG